MRNKVVIFLSLVGVSSLIVGCAGPEEKLGRGLVNTAEFARMGEIRRSWEQSTVFNEPGTGGTVTGIIHGIDQSVARTGVGLYEVLTFPIPNGTDYRQIGHYGDPVYPDSYAPHWFADTTVQPDANTGFSGGDIAPFAPGSRFHIFDN
jgi:putative exosortase-associated protein (TIGR04073 family)